MTTMTVYPEIAAFLSQPTKLLIGGQWVEAA